MELIIIVILLFYIAFLQYQLHRKTMYVEDLTSKMIEFERKLDPESITKLLKEKSTPDMSLRVNTLLEASVQRFLLEEEPTCKLFIHYTREEVVAKRIFDEGFIFADSFHKTAEAVTTDQINLVYKHYLHKNYGKYVVVIAISKDIFNYYTNEIGKTKKVLNVEQLLSEIGPSINDNDDEVYLLPKQFIKGYINLETGETIKNANYNPSYNSPIFKKNLEKLV